LSRHSAECSFDLASLWRPRALFLQNSFSSDAGRLRDLLRDLGQGLRIVDRFLVRDDRAGGEGERHSILLSVEIQYYLTSRHRQYLQAKCVSGMIGPFAAKPGVLS